MYKCMICNKECQNKGMGSHITRKHNMTVKEYYDLYMKKGPTDGYCKTCGKELNFIKLGIGYPTYCVNCAKKVGLQAIWDKYDGSPAKHKEIQDKMKATCLERYGSENVYASEYGKQKIKETNLKRHGVEYSGQIKSRKQKINFKEAGKKAHNNTISNVINYANKNNLCIVANLLDLYGFGWFRYFNPSIIKYKGYDLADKIYEQKAKEYYDFKQNNKSRSYCEYEILEYIKSIYNGPIKTNIRTIIKPYELDIYLPECNLAIEENDKFWHSKNAFSRIDDYDKYHKEKQDLCKNKNITLLYIDRDFWINNQKECKEYIKSKI